MYKSLTKTKQYSELEAHEALKRVVCHAMVLSFLKAKLVIN